MGLHYENLDETTRAYMIDEIDIAIAKGNLKINHLLNDAGKLAWPVVIREAIQSGDDNSLEQYLSKNELLKQEYMLRSHCGPKFFKTKDYDALMICEEVFNRYYARGVCRRAIDECLEEVEIYDASATSETWIDVYLKPKKRKLNVKTHHRSFVGRRLEPYKTLNEIRNQQVGRCIDAALGVPIGKVSSWAQLSLKFV